MFQKSAQANNKENVKAQNQRAFVGNHWWLDCCVTKPPHLVASFTKLWIQMDIYIYELIYLLLLSTIHPWRRCMVISHYRDFTREGHSISNHRQLGCSTEFRLTTKKTSKINIIGPLWGESTGDFAGMFRNYHTQLQLTECTKDTWFECCFLDSNSFMQTFPFGIRLTESHEYNL